MCVSYSHRLLGEFKVYTNDSTTEGGQYWCRQLALFLLPFMYLLWFKTVLSTRSNLTTKIINRLHRKHPETLEKTVG